MRPSFSTICTFKDSKTSGTRRSCSKPFTCSHIPDIMVIRVLCNTCHVQVWPNTSYLLPLAVGAAYIRIHPQSTCNSASENFHLFGITGIPSQCASSTTNIIRASGLPRSRFCSRGTSFIYLVSGIKILQHWI